jgi:hypothetical protein
VRSARSGSIWRPTASQARRCACTPRRSSFAAAHLLRKTGHTARDEVAADDIQGWMVWLLGRYSDSYASDQYRAFSGCTRSLRSALRFGQAWQRLACQGQAFLARDGARAPAQGEAQK